MQSAMLLLPDTHMPPFEDGVAASAVTPGQTYPAAVKTVQGLLLLGNAFRASRGDNLPDAVKSAPREWSPSPILIGEHRWLRLRIPRKRPWSYYIPKGSVPSRSTR
ncbi:hypothetical protein HPB50_023737 [Hyalomma asiaticum]|uniref:Uncharacterized protein n=1 Tax=Hyalomma asiaticum TaxID=266040 RepID=A0ACB7SKT2_HYAAI|nr:hypothetical protein HPB50_023737 [Hyalomma asiaticum]